MSDSSSTLRGPAGPVRFDAVEIARSRIGQREPDRHALKNQGPIVDWSLEGLTSHPASGDEKFQAGWAQWCAFFVCQCFRQALLARDQEELAQRFSRGSGGIQRIASGSCSALWERLSAQGWTWRLGQQLPPVLCPVGDAPGVPAKGDLVFFHDLAHVGFVDEALESGDIISIEGNAGPRADEVWRGERSALKIYGFARVPW